MSLPEPTLCIFHAGCDDGFASAYLVHERFPAARFHAGVHRRSPPPVHDQDVLLVDFSWPRDTMQTLLADARTVSIIDHHKTAIEQLQDLPFAHAVLDTAHCGAVLTWHALHPGRPVPEFFRYIEDHDLWRHALPRHREFTATVRSYPKTFHDWRRLLGKFKKNKNAFLDEGTSIERYYRGLVRHAKSRACVAEVGPHRFVAANAPGFLASDTAGELAGEFADDFPFAATFEVLNHEVVNFSLRSTPDGPDVSAIAQTFGGGGHHHAAGFTRPLRDIRFTALARPRTSPPTE